eukprot:11455550-Ditylum_brightwellii.AAC.1
MQHRHLPWNTVYFALSANRSMSAQQSMATEKTKRKSTVQRIDGGDDIRDIDESRTFFVTLSSEACIVNVSIVCGKIF